MRKEGREHGAGVLVEGQDALGRLSFEALDQTLAELRVQVEKARRAFRGEALVERLARLLGTQRVFLGQQDRTQPFEANPGSSSSSAARRFAAAS
jgi:hypothetical protein